MRGRVGGMLLVLGGCLLLAGGCAKQELVKTDEPLVPVGATPAATKPQTKVETAMAPSVEIASTKKSAERSLPQSDNGQLKASLDEIYFNYDSSNLSREARDTLVKVAEFMKKGQTAKVRIEGNCDERGSEEYNLALGEKRAKAAMQYLVTMGIPEERLSVVSYGKEKPADLGHDESAWAKNRRDEFAVISN